MTPDIFHGHCDDTWQRARCRLGAAEVPESKKLIYDNSKTRFEVGERTRRTTRPDIAQQGHGGVTTNLPRLTMTPGSARAAALAQRKSLKENKWHMK